METYDFRNIAMGFHIYKFYFSDSSDLKKIELTMIIKHTQIDFRFDFLIYCF